MKLSIATAQASTIKGFVWLTTFLAGLVLLVLGKDVTTLLILATGVVGGLGIGVKDELKDIIVPADKQELKEDLKADLISSLSEGPDHDPQ